MRVTTDEILALAERADLAGQRNIADRLYLLGGKMADRGVGVRLYGDDLREVKSRHRKINAIDAAAKRADRTILTEI